MSTTSVTFFKIFLQLDCATFLAAKVHDVLQAYLQPHYDDVSSEPSDRNRGLLRSHDVACESWDVSARHRIPFDQPVAPHR